jgi:hypothetical protein
LRPTPCASHARTIYEEIRALKGGRTKLPPARFQERLTQASTSHDDLRTFLGDARARGRAEGNEEALREFAQTQFAYYVSECGDDPDLAAAKVDALMLGFNCGVAAAREDA